MEIVVTIILLTAVALIFLLWTKTRREKTWPPGPPTIPFIGNLNIDVTNMLSTFRELRKQYGDVYSLVLGSQTVVVVCGLDTIKELLVKYGDVVSERPDTFIIREITHHKGIGGASGSLWREHRTFALSTLRDFGLGKRSMEGRIMEEVEVFINAVKAQKGQAFNIADLLHVSISNVICSMVFGERYDHDEKNFIGLVNAISDNLSNAAVTGLLTFFPFLKYIPGDPAKYSHVMGNMELVNQHLRRIVDEHKQKIDYNAETTNYIDAFLRQQKQATDIESTFTDDQLLQSIRDLFIAGTETTATALKWFIIFMLNNPDIQQRMREEILRVVGDSRFPSNRDRADLLYCDAVLHETLRFGNIVAMGMPHGLTTDLEFRGYTIPKHATVMPFLDSILNDHELFAEPFEFNPERFFKNGTLSGHEKVYAFGIGRRVCLGEALARMELFLFATTLIQRFNLLPATDDDIPSMTDFLLGMTRSPLPFKFRAEENV